VKIITDAIRAEADVVGKMGLTHEGVAVRCAVETSTATVRYYFRTMSDLRGVIEDV
jgi:hypothetical protein